MRVMVTGSGGFVGRHLVPKLAENGHEPLTVGRTSSSRTEHLRLPELPTSSEAWTKILSELKPDAVIHLAGQSHIPTSWQDVGETMRINVAVSAALMQAASSFHNLVAFLSVGSGQEYGHENSMSLSEDRTVRPNNPYAVSKVTASLLTDMFGRKNPGQRWLHARAFNHVGPGQRAGFVVSDICRQIAEIEVGKADALRVGNTNAVRDFLDVRDVVEAYILLLTHAPSGIFNVCSGTGRRISVVLEDLLSLATSAIRVEQDPGLIRTVDESYIVGNSAKIHSFTGWKPKRPWRETLADTLKWWRDATSWTV